MKKAIQKLALIMLGCSMVTGGVVGCGLKQDTSTSTTLSTESTSKGESKDGEQNVAKEEATGGFVDYSGGFPEQVTIQIPVYERGWEGWNPTDSYWTKYIQENFGDKYNVNVEFVSIGRSTEVVDFKQLLAAGTAPDIIFHYDYPNILDYYAEGAYQTLNTEEINYYAPTFWENMGEVIEEYGVIDGEQKVIMGDRVELLSKNYVTLIRQDWIDAVGKEMPTNLKEYNELLQAWQDAGLGYASEFLMTKSFNFDYAFRPWPAEGEGRALNSDLAVAGLTWEPTKEFLRNMNYQWNNGLISKEFYLDADGTQAKADFISGKAGVYKMYMYSTSIEEINNLLANCPEAKLAILDPYAGVPEGNKPQAREYWPFGMIFGINVNTSDIERQAIWMYLEWMSNPEVLFTLQNGFEGTHYELDEDGLPISLGYTGEQKLSNNDNADYWCFVNANKVYGSEELNNLAAINSYGPAGYEYLIEDTIANNKKIEEFATPDICFTKPISTVNEYSGDLASLFQELYVKCIMASPDEFEATYNAACEEYLEAGYQNILDEKKAVFDEGAFH